MRRWIRDLVRACRPPRRGEASGPARLYADLAGMQAERDFRQGRTCGPHCDARVLHAPGTCRVCDRFPTLQTARRVWGIAFTGEDPARAAAEGRTMRCPAELARDRATVYRWPGNRPDTGERR